jgi:hypothetical protein
MPLRRQLGYPVAEIAEQHCCYLCHLPMYLRPPIRSALGFPKIVGTLAHALLIDAHLALSRTSWRILSDSLRLSEPRAPGEESRDSRRGIGTITAAPAGRGCDQRPCWRRRGCLLQVRPGRWHNLAVVEKLCSCFVPICQAPRFTGIAVIVGDLTPCRCSIW